MVRVWISANPSVVPAPNALIVVSATLCLLLGCCVIRYFPDLPGTQGTSRPGIRITTKLTQIPIVNFAFTPQR